MSNLREVAKLIPDEYRKEMLELNMIDSAKAVADDPSMHYLVVIWRNYIDSSFEPECNLCRSTVLTNFKQMRDHLIELEKEHNLLHSV